MLIYSPQPAAALLLFNKYFLNRKDLYPINVCSRISVVQGKEDILLAHLTGKKISVVEKSKIFLNTRSTVKCGTYTPNIENKTKYACIDFDGKGHASPLKSPKDAVVKTYLQASALGIPSYIECSSGGQGYHLWIFFEEPIESIYARAICHCIIPQDIELADGSLITVGDNKGIEIFPKANELKKGGLGNQIWLPWWHGSADGGGIFYKLDSESKLEPYVPEKFDTCTRKHTIEKLNNYGGVEKIFNSKNLSYSNNLDKTNDVWKVWKKAVLENTDLETIYGPYLTGIKNGQWLECRDPWSASGDNNPSAGVANGVGDIQKGSWHSFITAETLSIFDFIRKLGITENNHLSACRYMAELTGIDLPKSENSQLDHFEVIADLTNGGNSGRSPELQDGLPQIVVSNRQLLDIIDDSWNAIHIYNTKAPRLFLKAGMLVRINDLEDPPSIHMLGEVEIYGLLSRAANWVKITQTGMMHAFPIDKVSKDMLVCEHPLKATIPKLEGVVTTPIFSRTGELVVKEGYNEGARVWYKPSVNLCEIPQQPSEIDVATAKQLLRDELLHDFPFCSESDIAHTYAAFILPFVRQLIDGPTPLHVVEAPGPGTGKSRICNLISILTTATQCEARTLPHKDDEIRKMITAELIKSKPLILIDNASEKKKIDSPSLAAVVTSISWTDRFLGESTMITLANYALWLLTANNPQFSMELARRCVRIRIDAKTDQPWKRKEFKHPYVEEWAKENRGLLVRAILILITNWIAKGRPCGTARLGSFERWSSVIGGILEVNGIRGFLGNLEELYESSDKEGIAWRAFVGCWFVHFGNAKKSLAELFELCEKNDLMSDLIGDGAQRTKTNKLGNALNQARDRVVGTHKIDIMLDGSFRLVNMEKVEEKVVVYSESEICNDPSEDIFDICSPT